MWNTNGRGVTSFGGCNIVKRIALLAPTDGVGVWARLRGHHHRHRHRGHNEETASVHRALQGWILPRAARRKRGGRAAFPHRCQSRARFACGSRRPTRVGRATTCSRPSRHGSTGDSVYFPASRAPGRTRSPTATRRQIEQSASHKRDRPVRLRRPIARGRTEERESSRRYAGTSSRSRRDGVTPRAGLAICWSAYL
jgi:hypothetical protein